MRAYRMVIATKEETWNPNFIYHVAEDEQEAISYFNSNFNRFNVLISITDISDSVRGRKMLEV